MRRNEFHRDVEFTPLGICGEDVTGVRHQLNFVKKHRFPTLSYTSKGFITKPKFKLGGVGRRGKADIRVFTIPHASQTIDKMVIESFAENIIEWSIDCL